MSHQSSPVEQLLGLLFMALLAAGAAVLLFARSIAEQLIDDDHQEGAGHDDSN